VTSTVSDVGRGMMCSRMNAPRWIYFKVILANDDEGSEEENDCMDNVNEVKELPVV